MNCLYVGSFCNKRNMQGAATLVSAVINGADGKIGRSQGVALRKTKTDQRCNVLNVCRANVLAAEVVEHGTA